MTLRVVLGAVAITLVVTACGASAPAAPPGQVDAQQACNEWSVYRSTYRDVAVGPYSYSIPSDQGRKHLDMAIVLADQAESASGRYTALAGDLISQSEAESEDTAGQVDNDCATI